MRIFVYLLIYIVISLPFELSGNESGTREGERNKKFSGEEKISYSDHTYVDYIKSVELYRSGWRLSAPFRNLRDTTTLILEFDDLSMTSDAFTYTLIHCSAGWEPSDIIPGEYLSGIPQSEIRDYRYSRNTQQPYTHYRLVLPNDDLQPRLPGNYILFVYKEYDQDQPVLTRRFFLIDPKVRIEATAHRTDNLNRFNTAQEIDFTVFFQELPLDDPRRNIRVTLLQNYHWHTAIQDLQPNYIQPDRLIYEYDDINLFDGGSEYRYFDTKNLKYNSERIREIRFERPFEHVYLQPDAGRGRSAYDYHEDLNGRYFIKWDEATDSNTEADYVKVHFSLAITEPPEKGDFYLFGGLTDFAVLPYAKMTLDQASSVYEGSLLLKQGYYNYQYAFLPEGSEIPDLTLAEGTHYETENDYFIFVYFRDIRERFDRLVGLGLINSVRMNKN